MTLTTSANAVFAGERFTVMESKKLSVPDKVCIPRIIDSNSGAESSSKSVIDSICVLIGTAFDIPFEAS